MTKPFTIFLILCLLIFQNIANTPITLSNNNQTISSTNTPNTLDTANTPSITPTPHKSLSGLNRDLSRSTTITKDIQTNALDSSLSIDNRIFNTNGRDDIASDIKNFKKNILVSGYGATNTLYNAINTPFQALSNKDISLKDTPTLWKLKQSQQSTALTRSQDDFAKDTLDNLSQGKDTLDIQYALALGIFSKEKPSKIYYNPNDETLGFHSTSQAVPHQNYLNAASGIITDTNATIFTDAHERAHTYTHSEALANIAGKEAIKAWNIANLIHTSINTNRTNTKPSKNLGLSSTNISSNTAYKDISKGVNNITPISQTTSQNALDDNNFGDLDLVDYQHLTPKFYLTPKSWLATQSKQSKSTLQSNTYNASLIDSVDRDNALPLVPIITFGMTAYRGYNFIQKLDKARDIIARANPQSDESSKSGDTSESNKSDKNQKSETGQNKESNNNGKFKDNKEADLKAKELGYEPDKGAGLSHGQKIYKHPKKNSYITRDIDSHSGGAWKEANSPKDLGSKNSRNGTYDKDLNKIGK